MADRDIQIPHSIPSLIYKESNGALRGFKQDLIQEDITEIFQQSLVCSVCSGVIRDAVQSMGRTVSHSCALESFGDIDKNVQDNVIECPYKAICCNTKEIMKKHLDEYLAENIIPKQKQLLAQFKDLQDKNEELIRINADLRHKMNSSSDMNIWYITLAILLVVMNIFIIYQLENDILFGREKNQVLINENIQELPTPLSSNFEGTEHICTNEDNTSIIDLVNFSEKLELKLENSISKINDKITNIQREIQKQLDERLPAVSKYIKERNKILQGVKWTHEYIESDIIIHGPYFYLGLCRLRIHAKFGYKNNKSGLKYYVTRSSGDYDGAVNKCHIAYICHFYEHIDGTKSSILEEEKDNNLEIDDQLSIQFFHYGFNFVRTQLIRNDKVTVKIYFDTENT
ncbi:hypothetical protein LOD99_2701 [Oopsacas minuta]|uniref:Uncharacterized protein n=1 Tax=Oopsacas minuta TaxID=111878 RepID=A0AAV7K0Z9_9METZ|nr:hypothetical protein LOD99_2701 [Oopsacas minuta]